MTRAKNRTIEEALAKKLSARLIAHTPLGDTELLNADLIAKHLVREIETIIKASKPERYTNNTIELPETDYQIKAYVRSVHNQAIDDYEANLLKILGGER